MADGHVGDHPIDEVRRGVAHPTRRAARADAAPATREGHEQARAAPVAVAADEPLLELATSEVGAELSHHEPRQRRRVAFFGMSDQLIQVLSDELVE